MKIGIMGGTFNPIHNGHLMIAEYAYKQYSLDEVWFLPNGNPPHKDNPDIAKETVARVEMTSLAIDDIPYFKLNTYESDRKEKSYSYQTLQYFKEQYPEHEFYFIIGADSLVNIENWKCPEKVISSVIILAAYRDDMDTPEEMYERINYLNDKYQGNIKLLKTPLLNISSHEIREAIQEKKSISEIPDKVWKYILDNHLYCRE